jgi:hypothetical protein
MPRQPGSARTEIRDVLVEAYAINDAMNQLVLSRLSVRVCQRTGKTGPTPTEMASQSTPVHERALLKSKAQECAPGGSDRNLLERGGG